jgi:hypothetical protein
MPILVQWKYQEKTKTFLVIFYFYDDGSSSNLRFGTIELKRGRQYADMKLGDSITLANKSVFGIPEDKMSVKPMMNWAPSHVELGYLSEVLRYANIIDGLSEIEKENLRLDLEYSEANPTLGKEYLGDQNHLSEIWDALESKAQLFCIEPTYGTHYRGVELCSEYIDYLKTVLEPYLK